MSDESVRRRATMQSRFPKKVGEDIVDLAADRYVEERLRNDKYLQGFKDGERNLADQIHDIMRTELYDEVMLKKIERLVKEVRRAQRGRT